MGELGDIYKGVSAGRSADREARLLNERAGARRAEGGAAAREERRQARLQQSRAQALAAASGASLADPTMINLMGDLDAEGEARGGRFRFGFREDVFERVRWDDDENALGDCGPLGSSSPPLLDVFRG